MKKSLIFLISLIFMASNSFANTSPGWLKNIPALSENPQAISPDVIQNNTALDLMLQNYRDGYVTITLASTSLINIGPGGVMLSNSGGSIRLMVANTSITSLAPTNIDTGTISASSTYYIYAYASTVTATTFSVIFSASATSPTGITYYKRIGSFTTNVSSNFVSVASDVYPYPFSTQTAYCTSFGTCSGRGFGTLYYNTNGRTMNVSVGANVGAGCAITATSDSSSSPISPVGYYSNSSSSGGTNGGSITFNVLPGNSYKVAITSCAGNSLQYWTEGY